MEGPEEEGTEVASNVCIDFGLFPTRERVRQLSVARWTQSDLPVGIYLLHNPRLVS